jgi:archaellum component FlaF (FlaF/FlaG flagellin family)
MGFSVTAANVIFLLAFLSAGSVAMNAYWKTQTEVQDAKRAEADRLAGYAHTNLTIAGVACVPADCDAITSVTIDVHNGGETSLNTTTWSYLLDGVVSTATPTVTITDPTVTISAPTELLLPGEDAAITLPVSGAPDSLDVKVVAENGASATGKVA